MSVIGAFPCTPKAEVTSSNLVGCANNSNNLADYRPPQNRAAGELWTRYADSGGQKETAALAGPLGDGTLNSSTRQHYLLERAKAISTWIEPPFDGEMADAVMALIEALDAIEGDPDLEDNGDAELCVDWEGGSAGSLP